MCIRNDDDDHALHRDGGVCCALMIDDNGEGRTSPSTTLTNNDSVVDVDTKSHNKIIS